MSVATHYCGQIGCDPDSISTSVKPATQDPNDQCQSAFWRQGGPTQADSRQQRIFIFTSLSRHCTLSLATIKNNKRTRLFLSTITCLILGETYRRKKRRSCWTRAWIARRQTRIFNDSHPGAVRRRLCGVHGNISDGYDFVCWPTLSLLMTHGYCRQ